MLKKIAIIGAGISGLVLANFLRGSAEVQVFEKARGVGGRMSTRYNAPFYFDHGTQCFTARTAEFKEYLKPFINDGTVSEWTGKIINLEKGKKETKRIWFEPHLVCNPNMNSLCKRLAEDVNIQLSTEVSPLEKPFMEQWQLQDINKNLLGLYDLVISTAPPVQTQRLFSNTSDVSSDIFSNSALQGCYALMLGFNKAWEKKWIAAKVRDNPIKWISINSSKPGRNNSVTCIVAHSRNDWAEEHINDDMEEAQKFLINQFEDVTGISCKNADYKSLHRWRYAIVEHTNNSGFYFNLEKKLAATGDWSCTSRIEEVWENAKNLASTIKKHIT